MRNTSCYSIPTWDGVTIEPLINVVPRQIVLFLNPPPGVPPSTDRLAIGPHVASGNWQLATWRVLSSAFCNLANTSAVYVIDVVCTRIGKTVTCNLYVNQACKL